MNRRRPKARSFQPEKSLFIPGVHAVWETLVHGGEDVQEIWIRSGRGPGRADEILRMAEERQIPVVWKEPAEFARAFPDVVHQGVAARVRAFRYSDVNGLAERGLKAGGFGLLLVADHVTDAGNLGALIRTAAFFGVHGVIVPEDRSARITPAVLKRSAGAYAHIPLARVVNIGRTLDLLSEKGYWIIGTSAAAAVTVYQFDWKRHVALVMGSEQKGLSRVSLKACHEVVSIPRPAAVESLNVSVAAGAILSEILRQRTV